MDCQQCGHHFESQEKCFPSYSSAGILMGYLCEKCRHKLPEIKCRFCGKAIQGEKGDGVVKEDDKGNLHLEIQLTCPHCSQNGVYNIDLDIYRKALKPGSVENMYKKKIFAQSNDPDIILVQDFLRRDYQLIGYSVNQENKILTVTMDFMKGNDKHTQEFRNCTKEFLNYVTCFQFVRDENLRSKLIFVEPEMYYKNSISPQKNINGKIEISGFTFTEFDAYPVKREIDKSDIFTFEIEVGAGKNQQFELIDYREPLNYYINDKIAFSGNISAVSGSSNLNLLRVFCLGLPSQLNASRINLNFNCKQGCGMDIAALVLDMGQIRYDIQGLHTNKRTFEIYIPINGLIIADKLVIGKVEFIQNLPSYSLLDRSHSFQLKTSYAHISLNCTKLYSAIERGLKFLQGAIGLMNFRIKIPTFINTYHFEDQNCCLTLGDAIYCRDAEYGTEFILNLPWLFPPSFEKSVLIEDYFKPIRKLATELLNPDKNLAPNHEKLLWVFYYLNLAETSVDKTVAFQHLWVAFDFLVSYTKLNIKAPFLRSDVKDVRTYCEEYAEKKLSELKQSGTSIDGETNPDKLQEKLTKIQGRLLHIIETFFNTPSELQQLELLLSKYSVVLSENEQDLLKTARKRRNDIIHGKKTVIVTRTEYNLVSKLIYFILQRLCLENKFKKDIPSK